MDSVGYNESEFSQDFTYYLACVSPTSRDQWWYINVNLDTVSNNQDIWVFSFPQYRVTQVNVCRSLWGKIWGDHHSCIIAPVLQGFGDFARIWLGFWLLLQYLWLLLLHYCIVLGCKCWAISLLAVGPPSSPVLEFLGGAGAFLTTYTAISLGESCVRWDPLVGFLYLYKLFLSVHFLFSFSLFFSSPTKHHEVFLHGEQHNFSMS